MYIIIIIYTQSALKKAGHIGKTRNFLDLKIDTVIFGAFNDLRMWKEKGESNLWLSSADRIRGYRPLSVVFADTVVVYCVRFL